jgi:hypothetical protein
MKSILLVNKVIVWSVQTTPSNTGSLNTGNLFYCGFGWTDTKTGSDASGPFDIIMFLMSPRSLKNDLPGQLVLSENYNGF